MNNLSAIILINDSITTATQTTFPTKDSPTPSTVQGIDVQLQINDTITFDEFNARIKADPNYPAFIHLNNLRVLVISSNFHDQTNRGLFDIVIFVKGGLASVLKNNLGPPGLTLDVQRLNIWNLVNGLKGTNNARFPFPGFLPPPQTQTPENPRPHEHLRRHRPEGLGALELFGTEAVQADDRDEGAFGGNLKESDDEGFAEGGGGDTEV